MIQPGTNSDSGALRRGRYRCARIEWLRVQSRPRDGADSGWKAAVENHSDFHSAGRSILRPISAAKTALSRIQFP